MKKIFLLVLTLSVLFMAVDLSAQQYTDWKWSHQTPQGNTLRWVKAWTGTTWYAVGFVGTFMKTTNAGANWYFHHTAGGFSSTSGQRLSMYDAHFFNMNTGCVFGAGGTAYNGIWRTTNGGVTFDSTNVTPFTTGIFYQGYFVNNNLGYAVGTATPKVFRTTNAGLTWEGITTAPTVTLYDVYAWDSLNVIVSSGTGTVYKTTDGGATWSAAISTGTSVTLYKMDFMDANTGFVAGAGTSFRYTTNGGLNWTSGTMTTIPSSSFYDIDIKTVSSMPPLKLNESFEDVTFPPVGWSSVNVLGSNVWTRSTVSPYAGTACAYIQYQTSGGDDWLISKKVMGISSDDSLVFWWRNAFSTAYPPDSIQIRVSTTDSLPASFTNILRTIDGSTTPITWTRYAVGLGAFNGQNIYVAFRHFDTDGNGGYLDNVMIGNNFTPVLTPKVYLTGNSFYIYNTTNFGTTWDSLSPLPTSQPWTSTYYSTDLSANGDSLVTVGGFGLINGVAGANKTAFTTFQKAGTINDIWAASPTGVVITVGASSSVGNVFDQIFRSTNGGATWAVVPYSTTSRTSFNSIDMVDNNTGYACGTLSALYKTTNGGANWDSVAIEGIAAATLNFRKVDFINANTGWLFSTSFVAGVDTTTIFKTTNGGTNWIKQRITGAVGTTNYAYGAFMINANTGWLLNYTPRPYITTDGGNTWTVQNLVDNFGGFLYDIKMFNASTGYIVGSSGRFYKTTDGGNFWDTVSIPTRSYTIYQLDFLDPSRGMFVGTTGTAFYTTNGGTTWTYANTSGSTINALCLTSNGTAFAAGTSGNIFKNTASIVTDNQFSFTEIPRNYELFQNYPNPFNPTTTIQFSMPKAGIVTLKIYDVAGREVMRLVNDQSFAAGMQKVQMNGSRLSSGVYFYSLIVDNNLVDTKKMVLVK